MKEIKIKVEDEQAKLIKEGKLTFALVETEAIKNAEKAEDADGGFVLIVANAADAQKVGDAQKVTAAQKVTTDTAAMSLKAAAATPVSETGAAAKARIAVDALENVNSGITTKVESEAFLKEVDSGLVAGRAMAAEVESVEAGYVHPRYIMTMKKAGCMDSQDGGRMRVCEASKIPEVHSGTSVVIGCSMDIIDNAHIFVN